MNVKFHVCILFFLVMIKEVSAMNDMSFSDFLRSLFYLGKLLLRS